MVSPSKVVKVQIYIADDVSEIFKCALEINSVIILVNLFWNILGQQSLENLLYRLA